LLVRHHHQPRKTLSPCYAGFGSTSSAASSKAGKKTTSEKKKVQIKERILKEYGGDIAKGTEQRMQAAMRALPVHEKLLRFTKRLLGGMLMYRRYL